MDALTLKAAFKKVEYTYSHNSLIGNIITDNEVGVNTTITPKY